MTRPSFRTDSSAPALEQKYQALLQEAMRRELPGTDDMRLCFQALSLASAIDRDCAALLAPHGLSEGRFVLLFLLNAAGTELAPHTLAQRAGIARATVTGLLDGLEREALLMRQADPNDRRALLVKLTPKGKRLAGRIFNQHGRWIASLFGGLNPTERTQFSQLLGKVAAQLGQARPEATT